MTAATASKDTKQDIEDGRTIFLRNLSFDTEGEDLQEILTEFGELEYCVVCVDNLTGHPKGSAFAKFKSGDSTKACLDAAANQDERLFVDGRRLYVSVALPRTQIAQKLADNKKDRDKRNLYLAKEGLIYESSPAAEGVSQVDLEKRLTLEQRKRKQLQDITRFISATRLCVHNLPGDVDDKKLRKIFAEAVSDKSAKIVEARVMRNRNASNKLGKSSGFGFVEFAAHEHALEALRKLNNNPETFTDQRRPIVEFSVENRKALNKKLRQRAKNEKAKAKKADGKALQKSKKAAKKEVTKEETEEDEDVSAEQQDDAAEEDGDDEAAEDLPYVGMMSRPLKGTEKVVAPKLNRKVFEARKKLKERRKKLKKEQKAEKEKQQHVVQKEEKIATKKVMKIVSKKLGGKRKTENDLDPFEASFLDKKKRRDATKTKRVKTPKIATATSVAPKVKWFSDAQ